jgi:autotransporter translocation and assembly factor TamB
LLARLLVSFVVVVTAILGLIVCTADADSLCWNNQQLVLSDQQIVTYGGVGEVQILTAENFTLATNGGEWFVKFYAP